MTTSLLAGFADVEITPPTLPVRAYRAVASEVLDPLYAHAAVFRQGPTALAMVSLDVVIVEQEVAQAIRRRVASQRDLPAGNILVCATHNHSCPAVIARPGFPRADDYVAFMVERAAEAVIAAYDRLTAATVSVRSGLEHRLSFNRRFITRDGCVVTSPRASDLPRVLCNENVIDPEVGVVRVSSPDGRLLGLLVNFGCHACHHGGRLSAGYPGELCRRLKERLGTECGTVFLNGACGNVYHGDFLNPHLENTKERTGGLLAETVLGLLSEMPAPADASVRVLSTRFRIPYRDFVEAERLFDDPAVRGNVFRALIMDGWYDYPALQRMAQANQGGEEVEIQVFRLGEAVFAAIPAEYFMEHGLRIKELSPVERTYVVSLANGWVGYIPTKNAFQRKGGHETTAALWSKMCQEAGDMMADAALELIRKI